MRSFSKEEQRVIDHIVNNASRSLQYVLINAYYDIFYNNKVDYNVQNPGHLIFYRDYTSIDLDEILSIQQQIIIQSRLIQYLVDNRLIYLIENNSVNEIGNVANFITEGLTAINVPIDSITAEIIQDSLRHYIIVTQDLKNLVANGYISDEERRHQEQLKATKRSYIVALIGLIVAIIVPIVCSRCIPITIEEQQYTTTTKFMDKSSTQLEKVVNAVNNIVEAKYLQSAKSETDSISIQKK